MQTLIFTSPPSTSHLPEASSLPHRNGNGTNGSRLVSCPKQTAPMRNAAVSDCFSDKKQQVRRRSSSKCCCSTAGGESTSSTTRTSSYSRSRRSWGLKWDMRYLLFFLVFAALIFGTQAQDVEDDDEDRPSTTTLRTSTRTNSSATRTPSSTSTPSEDEDDDEDLPTPKPTTISNRPVVDSGFEGFDINSIKPYDQNLNPQTFTDQGCYDYIHGLKSDPDFMDCLPLSHHLTNSQSFFQAQRNGLVTTTTVLDKMCSVPYEACVRKMDTYADRFKTACKTDLELRHTSARDAYAAFLSFGALYSAGCLKSEDGAYCFAEATTSTAKSHNFPIYTLALGKNLPANARLPDCNSCTGDAMAFYADVAGRKGHPLSEYYNDAAERLNAECGAEFARLVEVPGRSGAVVGRGRSAWGVVVAVVACLTMVV